MSSAEDKTSSTVLPSQGSSNSAPEDFPVEAHPIAKDDCGAAPSHKEPPIEMKTGDSPEPSPAEPGEAAAAPLRTKPLPKATAIAREVPVRVTGAKAGIASEERDLFSELTASVMVFEKGGVIRLTAAVTPGQLLFLSNEESKREVVTQVTRKRTHKPTECYVELEFTEPAPGFWGTEFSAATALLPKDANLIAAAELIASAETTDDELDQATPPPSAEQVEALRSEVAALRSQLSAIQMQPPPLQAEPATAIPKPPSVTPVNAHPPQPEEPSYQTEKVAWSELTADVAPMEGEPKSPPEYSLDQKFKDLLPKPDPQPTPPLVFRKSMLPPKRSFRARGEFTPGFRSGMLRVAMLSGVLAALIGFVWYKHWFPWMHQTTKFSVSTWAGGVTTKVAAPETSPTSPASLATGATNANTGAREPLSAKGATPVSGSSSATPADATAGKEIGSTAYEVVEKPAVREKSRPAASTEKFSSVRSVSAKELPTKAVAVVPVLPASARFIPPKLVQSQRADASLEDLHDFETGSVVIDAIIDMAGNVTSPTVLSGPPSLRRPALEALKYYKYVPAVQNGQPVPAHVSIKIQFHFE